MMLREDLSYFFFGKHRSIWLFCESKSISSGTVAFLHMALRRFAALAAPVRLADRKEGPILAVHVPAERLS